MSERTDTLFISPLNGARKGPFTSDVAISEAASYVWVSDAHKKRIANSIAAGDDGPWHFIYGFQSVTIERGQTPNLASDPKA